VISCVLCGIEIDAHAHVLEHRRNGVPFRLYLCRVCDAEFWEPRFAPDAAFYEKDAEAVSPAALARHTVGSRRLQPNHETFFAHHPSGPGSIFDIGCGDGHFLQAAKKRGFHVAGMDFDAKALEVARKRGLERLYCGSIDSVAPRREETEERYDFVTFFEVLEHQIDPNEFMRSAARLLRPGGMIAGSVPNRNCFRTGALEIADRPPYHFTRWSETALRGFLERLGFRDMIVMDVGFGYYLLSLFEGLNFKAKRALLRETSRTALKTCSVEEVAIDAGASASRRTIVRVLKKLKAILFMPCVIVESAVGRILGKGQYLYFEGKLSS
jgi:SAM-dependent methyltransferase